MDAKSYLIEILEYYIYRLKGGKCTMSEIQSATKVLEENMDTSSGDYSFYHLYIELCEKEGNYDEAVDCMIEYLTHLGKDEVTSENLYYKKLIDYEYPISEESQQKIDEFLT